MFCFPFPTCFFLFPPLCLKDELSVTFSQSFLLTNLGKVNGSVHAPPCPPRISESRRLRPVRRGAPRSVWGPAVVKFVTPTPCAGRPAVSEGSAIVSVPSLASSFPPCVPTVCADRAGRERAASLCLVPCHCCITLVCGRSEPRPWRGCGEGGRAAAARGVSAPRVGGGGSAAGLPHGRLRPSRWEGGPAPPPESQESSSGAPGALCPGGSCSRGGASPAGPAASLPLCAGPCKTAVVGHSEREGTFFKAVSLSGQVN